MTGGQSNENSEVSPLKTFLQPYVSVVKAIVLPYVIFYVLVGLALAWVMAKAFPEAFAIVVAVLVIIGIASLLGILYLLRRFQHLLIARRADNQNAAFIRGKERGTYGNFRPEDLR
jgi:uncharacterized membrane protein (DUF485 family)